MPSDRERTYLCLLDDVDLRADVSLGDCAIQRLSFDALRDLLHEPTDVPISRADADDLTLCSLFPWALRHMPSASAASGGRKWPHVPPAAWDSANFFWRNSGPTRHWPFDELLLVLNLLKPSAGPVIARRLYMARTDAAQTKRPLKIIRSRPLTDQPGSDGPEMPLLGEYSLDGSDAQGFSVLAQQVAQCLAPAGANPHLETAAHLFTRADQWLVPFPESFECLDPLLAYEGALEALLLREKERESDVDRLSRRARTLFDGEPQIRDFVRRVHWLRSKCVHAVRTVAELEAMIVSRPDDAIVDPARPGLGTAAGNYSSLLLTPGAFPGLLVNLREVVRRCIRYFMQECENGRSREQTLDALEHGQCISGANGQCGSAGR